MKKQTEKNSETSFIIKKLDKNTVKITVKRGDTILSEREMYVFDEKQIKEIEKMKQLQDVELSI